MKVSLSAADTEGMASHVGNPIGRGDVGLESGIRITKIPPEAGCATPAVQAFEVKARRGALARPDGRVDADKVERVG